MNVPSRCSLQNIAKTAIQMQYTFDGLLLTYLLAGAVTKPLLHSLQNQHQLLGTPKWIPSMTAVHD